MSDDASTEPPTGPVERPERPGPVAPVLVVGCGNRLCGDDAAGPLLVERLARHELPEGVELVDAGTAGIDAVLAMRGRRKVVVLDAVRTGAEPGTLHRVPAERLAALPPGRGLGVHAVRWDHALALGRALLGEDLPAGITVLLVEAGSVEPGTDPGPAVAAALDGVARAVLDEVTG